MKNNLISGSNIINIIGFISALCTVLVIRPALESMFSEKVASIIYICLVILVLAMIFIPVVIKLTSFFFKSINRFIGYKAFEKLGLDYIKFVSAKSGGGRRIDEFQALRKRANHSIFIMGIGMRNVSKETSAFREQIDSNNIKYRILMLSHKLMDNDKNNEKSKNIANLFGEFYFSRYFASTGYELDVIASYTRLREFYMEMKKYYGASAQEKIEMKEISKGFFPINMTAIDYEYNNGELLFDFCFPLSTIRLIFKLSKEKNCELFNDIINICNKIYVDYSDDVE